MTTEEKLENLEKRLENTERALCGLWSLLEDTVEEPYRGSLDRMFYDFFQANIEFGAIFSAPKGKHPFHQKKVADAD